MLAIKRSRFGRPVLWLTGSLGFLAAAVSAWIYASTYHPGAIEPEIVVTRPDAPVLTPGARLKVMTWNVQFFAGNRNNFFFFDGGPDPWPPKGTLLKTAARIAAVINAEDPDIVVLQELDEGAARTYFLDQVRHLVGLLPKDYVSHASSFYWKADFMPSERMDGPVGMKLAVISKYRVGEATRHALPPISTDNLIVRQFNLKRAILAVSMPIDGGGTFTVLTTHLSAFSRGTETMQRQVAVVGRVFEQAGAGGGPVLLAGDFNLLASAAAYERLGPRGRKEFNPEGTELEPLLDRYRSIPSLAEINGEDYARWHTSFATYSEDERPDKIIDYMFVSRNLAIGDHYVRASDTAELSDHLPLVAYVTLP